MATMIRNVYHTYSQARTVIKPEAIAESCSSYNLIWICAKTLLQSVVSKWNSLPNLPADVVNAPSVNAFKNQESSRKVLAESRNSLQLQIPTIELSSVVTFRSGYKLHGLPPVSVCVFKRAHHATVGDP